MGNYTHTSFGRLCRIVAQETNKSLCTDRREIHRIANRVRQWLFSAYTRLRMAVDVEECVTAETFCQGCNDCDNTYVGISLPPDMINAASIWHNKSSAIIHSRWKEYQDGINRLAGDKVNFEAVYVGIPSPTERDILPCGSCVHVGFQAESLADNGKIITVAYSDVNGVEHIDRIKLVHNQYVPTNSPVKSFTQPAGITQPEDMCGGVIVAQMDTMRIISEYKPWEHKPAYRRIALPGMCCGASLLVRGTRRYHDLYYDYETAEISNELAIIAVVRFLKHSSSADPNGGHQAMAKFHEAEAMKYISGDMNRETGASTAQTFQHTKHNRRQRGQRLSMQ